MPIYAVPKVSIGAALGIILSPTLSLPFGKSINQDQGLANNEDLGTGPVGDNNSSSTSPPITQQDAILCSSWSESVRDVIGNETAGAAVGSPLLVSVLCDQRDLIHEVQLSENPGINMVAYGCRAASGKAGDEELTSRLANYQTLYCSSAKTALLNESSALLADVEAFKTDFPSQMQNSTDANNEANTARITASVDNIISTINGSTALIESRPYEAAKGLDKASSMFTDVIAEVYPSS